MNKLITFILRRIDDLGHLLKILCSFFILVLLIYWLEIILKIEWHLLDFIKPTLDSFLNFAYAIVPVRIGVITDELSCKFVIAIALLLVLLLILRYVSERLDLLKVGYDKFCLKYQQCSEKSLNKRLNRNIEKEQMKILKYTVWIGTSIKKKFLNATKQVNLDEQNELMNKYIYEKLRAKYLQHENGFLYSFDDFNQIDAVLDVFFKMLKSNSPLDYKICICIDFNPEQLKKLIDLNNIEKITTCADTVLRYKFNKSHRYGTQSLGVYQIGDGTLEVHEFHEIL